MLKSTLYQVMNVISIIIIIYRSVNDVKQNAYKVGIKEQPGRREVTLLSYWDTDKENQREIISTQKKTVEKLLSWMLVSVHTYLPQPGEGSIEE